MAKVAWPEEGKRSVIGKRISRVDGPAKVTGEAKYAYDINRVRGCFTPKQSPLLMRTPNLKRIDLIRC
jgi:hypothetical protein